MRRGKMAVWLLTAFFLAVSIFVGLRDRTPDAALFSVRISSDGRTETIDCWENEEGEAFVFLPSYAQPSGTQIHLNGSRKVSVNGIRLTDGMTGDCFAWNVPSEMTASGHGSTRLTVSHSGNVATLYIRVGSGDMEYIHQKKGNRESGSLSLYTADGQVDYAGMFASLEGHGNSSWNLEKKSYNLTLSSPQDLLGMGGAQKWILLANGYDASHLRNKLLYELAGDMGLAYSPDSRWVDLYLNGRYAGLYLLCERNEVAPNRVELADQGSFLVSKEWEWRMEEQGIPFLMTRANTALRVHDATMPADEVLRRIQTAENAILSPDGIDPETGKHWRECIDTDSWVRKYLFEEVFANVDGQSLSQFFYCDGADPSGKIFAGPVWDYDLAMGNEIAIAWPAEGMFFVNKPDIWGSDWYPALYRDPELYRQVVEQYARIVRPLLEELLESGIPANASRIASAAAMNQLRWPHQNAVEETERILVYMTGRMEFLDSVWLRQEPYVYVLATIPEGASYYYALHPGESLPQLLDDSGWWEDSGTGEIFDPSQPLEQDVSILFRLRE